MKPRCAKFLYTGTKTAPDSGGGEGVVLSIEAL